MEKRIELIENDIEKLKLKYEKIEDVLEKHEIILNGTGEYRGMINIMNEHMQRVENFISEYPKTIKDAINEYKNDKKDNFSKSIAILSSVIAVCSLLFAILSKLL